MAPRRRRRSYPALVGLALAGALYAGLVENLGVLTGASRLDGSIGVVLGLYICSHPVANLLDMLLFGRSSLVVTSSRRATIAWVASNLAVLGVGWFVIMLGATRFTAV